MYGTSLWNSIKQISCVIPADNGPHWIISLTLDCIKTFCSEGIASKTWTDELIDCNSEPATKCPHTFYTDLYNILWLMLSWPTGSRSIPFIKLFSISIQIYTFTNFNNKNEIKMLFCLQLSEKCINDNNFPVQHFMHPQKYFHWHESKIDRNPN